MKRILVILAGIFLIPALEAQPLDFVPIFQKTPRLQVRPVFFVPKGVPFAEKDRTSAQALLAAHLDLARKQFTVLLKTDTFAVSGKPALVYRSQESNDVYARVKPEDRPDSAHRILAELFSFTGENRYDSESVFLVIYIRPASEPYDGKFNLFGGGRTFNGPPGSGGGYIEMEYSALLTDSPYPFQSTLVHELGHAFGLTHVTGLGYSLETHFSIMSYNPAHHSRALVPSDDPGGLLPEEVFLLSLNKGAFPRLRFDEALHGKMIHSRDELALLILPPMENSVGAFRDQPGVGYELYFDGRRVNGPDASLYTYRQARENFQWNRDNQTAIAVTASYNGVPLSEETK